MPNLRRSVLFTALAALLAGSVVSAAVAVTPTSPNKDQSAGKSAPQTVPEDPATSGSSTEPLTDCLVCSQTDNGSNVIGSPTLLPGRNDQSASAGTDATRLADEHGAKRTPSWLPQIVK